MEKIDEIIKNLKKAVLPAEEEVYKICDLLTLIFCSEPNMLILDAPITIVGDIHGQFYDLLEMFRLFGDVPQTKFLFLGDIVDRGANSVETILLLIALKLKYPKHIYILRGNHESIFLSAKYGFMQECEKKYDIFVYKCICDLFLLFPFCAEINDIYFCIHGGIVSNLKLELMEKYNRMREDMDMKGVLWSDPTKDIDYYAISPRGAGQLFGQYAADEFMGNRHVCILRSHQLVEKGFEMSLKNVFTVWSAPNYCYLSGNEAAVAQIRIDLKIEFTRFNAVKYQKG